MKKIIIMSTLVFAFAVETPLFAQTNFYSNVTNLWYQGQKSNVLEIAEQRLNVNSNDIAGLILKAEYSFEFYEMDRISNAFLRVIQVSDAIITTNFLNRYQGFSRERILSILSDFAEEPVTNQDIQDGKQKALINQKPLPNGSLIEALQKDGYFN
ncbi:MAG: hypothetical protein WCP12_17835 [bacterium]